MGHSASRQQVRWIWALTLTFARTFAPFTHKNTSDRSEYITIVSIMVCMTVWDFVIGVLFGIVVSCEPRFFVAPVFPVC